MDKKYDTPREEVLNKHDKAIVLSSMSRCGSTLLYLSIGKYKFKKPFVTDISNMKFLPRYAYKTHDCAPIHIHKGVKTVYLFGDVFNIIASNFAKFSNKGTLVNHMKHFHADPKIAVDMLTKDVFGLEHQFDSWNQRRTYPIMLVRYETMWDNLEAIRSYLGLPVELPPFKKRKKWVEELNVSDTAHLEKTYESLYDKISKVDDIVFLKPRINDV